MAGLLGGRVLEFRGDGPSRQDAIWKAEIELGFPLAKPLPGAARQHVCHGKKKEEPNSHCQRDMLASRHVARRTKNVSRRRNSISMQFEKRGRRGSTVNEAP